MSDYTWHSIINLPEHDGWIWITTGLRKEGSAIKSYYYKKEGEHKHGYKQLRDVEIGVNKALYWMWQIPIENKTLT